MALVRRRVVNPSPSVLALVNPKIKRGKQWLLAERDVAQSVAYTALAHAIRSIRSILFVGGGVQSDDIDATVITPVVAIQSIRLIGVSALAIAVIVAIRSGAEVKWLISPAPESSWAWFSLSLVG